MDSSRAPSVRPGSIRLRDRLKEATHGAILDAAEAVFARDGVQRARMEDVAAEAGVAVGTLYNYFTDRNALLEALLDARGAALFERIDAALADKKQPFEQRLEAFLSATVEHFLQHTGMFAVIMESEFVLRAQAKKDRPRLRALIDRTTKLLREGVSAGVLRADDAELFPDLLIGMLRGAFIRHIHGLGDPPARDVAQRIARAFLSGAGTAPALRGGAPDARKGGR
jgi:AcrR family transcriptional regulator